MINYFGYIPNSRGGYGLCKDWLEVFNILTYLYTYERLTKTDLLDYVYALKRNVGNSFKVNVTSFLLDSSRKTFKINAFLVNDFMKYDLMNALQNIVEKKLYFPESYMGEKTLEFIKKIIQTYTLERENMLELIDHTYQRNLTL